MAPRIGTRELIRLRLRAQRLEGERLSDPTAVVSHLLAVQAQDFAGACWALGLRTHSCRLGDVTDALDAGRVIRSWPMRGTLHFIAPEDLRWMLRVTADRMLASVLPRLARIGLDDSTIGRAEEVAIASLSGGRSLARREFQQAMADAGIPVHGELGYQLIYVLAQRGLICWGPSYRNQQALVLVDDWLPPPEQIDREVALRRFVLRFAAARGPIQPVDFQWWTKSTVADTRLGFELAGDQLERIECDGEEYWVSANSAAADSHSTPKRRAASDRFRALPGFDEYLIGPNYRRQSLNPEHAHVLFPPKTSLFQRSIIDRGVVVASWRPDPKDADLVAVSAADELTQTQVSGAEAAIARWRAFMPTR